MTSHSKIPPHWEIMKLGDLRRGNPGTLDPQQYPDETFELYSIPAYDENEPQFIKGSDIGSRKKILTPNTVLLSKINPRINRVWTVNGKGKYRQIGSTEWVVFEEVSEIDQSFLRYLLQSPNFRNHLQSNVSGIGGSLMRVNRKTIDKYSVQIPPKIEQQSIVNKIEELFSRLDSGVTELQEASLRFVQYRRSVLRNAMRGKLTESWRIESKINTERGNSIDDVEPLSAERVNQLFDIPEDWVWTTYGEIVKKSRNGFSKRSGEDGIPTPVLRLADIKQGEIDFSDPRDILMNDNERHKFLLESGDLLCTRVNGSENLVGRLAVFDEDGDWAFCDHFIRYKLNEFAIPRFVDKWFDSSAARRYVRSNMVSSAGQNTVSQTTMEQAPVPLCSVEEQQKVLDRIDQRISVIEYLISTTDQLQAKAKRLRMSILKQAFNGNLVQPNPTEEPITPDSGDTDLEQGLQATPSEATYDVR
jgi:type I restriction enzyme S subunit